MSIKRCECVPDLENSFLTVEIELRTEKVSQEQPVSCIAALAMFATVKLMEKAQERKSHAPLLVLLAAVFKMCTKQGCGGARL